ncbi:MAG: peptidylprolyl isomerase [Leptolyngbyaceae cyanobacterium CSU_1_3]|nr:peptidylprolyl isomerase [Leptolyngbyaceae cyanobacterium CSU_1_3]
METFDTLPFLTIADQTLSLGQVLRYLQLSGKLVPLIQDVVAQHVIYQEMQTRNDLDIDFAELEQSVIDFRLKQELLDAKVFRQWLDQQGIDYATFQSRMVLSFKLRKLKDQVAQPGLSEYFADHQTLLDQVELSCVAIAEKELAEQLTRRLLAATDFDQIVKEYALANLSKVSVWRSSIRYSQLPEELREALPTAMVGDSIGPLQIDGQWCLFRIEKFHPAVLESSLKQELQEQLFQQWLIDRVNHLPVKLAIAP